MWHRNTDHENAGHDDSDAPELGLDCPVVHANVYNPWAIIREKGETHIDDPADSKEIDLPDLLLSLGQN